MHDGEIVIRSNKASKNLPKQVSANIVSELDISKIEDILVEFLDVYGYAADTKKSRGGGIKNL